MPFERGTVTFSMFELRGDLPEDLPGLFAAKKAGLLDSVDAEPQLGWVTGHHLLDTTIDEASAQVGGNYYLMLRTAVRKMPGSLLNALCKREEQAYMRANNLEYVSAKMKKQIREETLEKHIQKMPPALSGIPLVLDPNEKLLFVGATSRTQIELFIDNFFQATKLEPLQLTPGLMLEQMFQTTEASFPALNIGSQPGSAEPTIGRDFLMWLWFYSETIGKLRHPQYGEFDILIEAPLVLADDGEPRGAGEVTIKKGNAPLRSAEAQAAILTGKKLKKVKLSLTREKQVWTGTFAADQFAFSSFKLPEGDALTNEDELFAERMQNMILFREAIMLYFKKFADTMMGMEFPKFEAEIRAWAKDRDAL